LLLTENSKVTAGEDPGFWFGKGNGKGFGDESPPAGSRSRAPVGSGEKPEECYVIGLNKNTYEEKKNKSIQTDIV